MFAEIYVAFQTGRVETDPSINWAIGEIGFYDFYIIPLAKKLKDCGVFGVSSDEYLNYALANRREWESRGDEIVGEMVERLQSQEKQHGAISTEPEKADNIALQDIQFRLTRKGSLPSK